MKNLENSRKTFFFQNSQIILKNFLTILFFFFLFQQSIAPPTLSKGSWKIISPEKGFKEIRGRHRWLPDYVSCMYVCISSILSINPLTFSKGPRKIISPEKGFKEIRGRHRWLPDDVSSLLGHFCMYVCMYIITPLTFSKGPRKIISPEKGFKDIWDRHRWLPGDAYRLFNLSIGKNKIYKNKLCFLHFFFSKLSNDFEKLYKILFFYFHHPHYI
jgi:hypothetical protein